MTTDRDDFTLEARRVLALRAAHRCSNPACRSLTVQPHSDAGRAVVTGVAAHICAAAPGGPRFDPTQTSEDRKAAANGICVCHNCSDLVDKDSAGFSTSVLREWKLRHEAWVAREDFVPALPGFTVQTFAGLVLPVDGAVEITGEMVQQYRDHEIQIGASSRHELSQLRIRIQFPEGVLNVSVREKPVGVGVDIRPERMEWIASASGGGSVTRTGSQGPTSCFIVEQERVIPGRSLRLIVRTIQAETLSFPKIWSEDAWFTYAEGTFLYLDQGQYFERAFLVKLDRDDKRTITAMPTEEPCGQTIVHLSGFGF